MLHDRNVGLKEIARTCGFCNVFHFSKRFKQAMRMTPTEYRNRRLHEPVKGLPVTHGNQADRHRQDDKAEDHGCQGLAARAAPFSLTMPQTLLASIVLIIIMGQPMEAASGPSVDSATPYRAILPEQSSPISSVKPQ